MAALEHAGAEVSPLRLQLLPPAHELDGGGRILLLAPAPKRTLLRLPPLLLPLVLVVGEHDAKIHAVLGLRVLALIYQRLDTVVPDLGG